LLESAAAVLGLAVLDSVNPSALLATLYLLLRSGRYVTNVLSYVAGVFGSYLLFGLLLLFGLDVFWGYLDGPVVYAIQGIVGAALFLYGILSPSKKKNESEEQPRIRMPGAQHPAAMLGLGVTITVFELPTALPYFAAIAIMTDSDVAAVSWLPVLLIYNVIFVLPPLALLAAYRLFGDRLEERFTSLRDRLQRGTREATLWIAAIVGFFLLADALTYFEFFGLIETE
jgi:cytochrome c biogenesis protein CcdA